MNKSWGIHWFRRDLRIDDNPALKWSREEHAGRVVGVFCFDKVFLARSDFSPGRFQFYLKTLSALRDELRELGSDLLVLDVGPEAAFKKLFAELKTKPATVSWNRDYEPFAIRRDAMMEKFFGASGVAIHHDRDHLLIEPSEIYKGDDPNDGYQVFTPFRTKWLDHFPTPGVQSRLAPHRKLQFVASWTDLLAKPHAKDLIKEYSDKNAKLVDIPIPDAGAAAAAQWVKTFRPKLELYGSDRDIPGVRGTSGFSIFFKNGSLTVAQVIRTLKLTAFTKKDTSGAAKFFSELIWREFYYHILARFPRVETEAFQAKYAKLKWPSSEKYFEAWKAGLTGYPIVDAGMRQLNTTGWMHNRVRMIVASFLTKDLLVDYKWGEQYFMEKLLDGDLAPNNGGWQWAASTGCDPQPYFRIFNPKLQSERFDPEGSYIRKYVPELAHVRGKAIHEPDDAARAKGYPEPIVNHFEQKEKALALFRRNG